MRTIKAAIQDLKASDPHTNMTEWALRRIIREGVLPHINIGSRILVDLDLLDDFLKGSSFNEQV
jgi:hypothetical protein